MKRVLQFSLPLVVLLLQSCSQVSGPDGRERELSYLRCIMPENLLEFAHVEVSAIENIAIQGEGADQYLGLHLFAGQKKINKGLRAEISVDYPHQSGDTVRYAWRFMVPKGFQSDAPQNRWWIIGQWHDQPNRDRGESWDGFPSNSPPVLLSIGELDGRLGIGMAYGPDQSQKRGPFFIEPGRWHSIAVEIRWAQSADGRAVLFLDDMNQPTAEFDGPNMHNDFRHFLKLGMYRHPEIATDNWIYLDDLTITTQTAR